MKRLMILVALLPSLAWSGNIGTDAEHQSPYWKVKVFNDTDWPVMIKYYTLTAVKDVDSDVYTYAPSAASFSIMGGGDYTASMAHDGIDKGLLKMNLFWAIQIPGANGVTELWRTCSIPMYADELRLVPAAGGMVKCDYNVSPDIRCPMCDHTFKFQ